MPAGKLTADLGFGLFALASVGLAVAAFRPAETAPSRTPATTPATVTASEPASASATAPSTPGYPRGPLAPSGAPADLVVDAPSHDFGRLLQGELVRHTFVLRNRGAVTRHIRDVSSTCGCATTVVRGREIAPGDTAPVEVVLQTAPLLGQVTKSVDVLTDDPGAPVVTLLLTVTSIPMYLVEPAALDFGTATGTGAIERRVRIRHGEGRPFTVAEWWGLQPPFTGEWHDDPADPGAKWLTVRVTPPPLGGGCTGHVQIRTDPPGPAPLGIPFRAMFEAPLEVKPHHVWLGRFTDGSSPEVLVVAGTRQPGIVLRSVEVVPVEAGTATLDAEAGGRRWTVRVRPGTGAAGAVRATLRLVADGLPGPLELPIEGYRLR